MSRLPEAIEAVRDNDLHVPPATNEYQHDAPGITEGRGEVAPPPLMDDEYWDQFPEPLTLQALAKILRVSEATVLRRLQDSTIPGHFIGRSWIIFQCEFRTWLATTRNQPLTAAEGSPTAATPPANAVCDPLEDYDDQLGMSELMELFDKTKQTIRKWLTDNALPGYKIAGRWIVYKSELREALARTSNQRAAGE